MASGALGPMGSIDNGDGTFTFQMPDGSTRVLGGPIAQQKHAELSGGATASIDPAVIAGFNAQDNAFQAAPPGVHDASGPVMPQLPGAPPPRSDDPKFKLQQPEPGTKSKGTGGGPASNLVGAGPAASAGNQIPTVVTGTPARGGPVVPGHMQLAGTTTSQTKVPEVAGQRAELGLATQEEASQRQTEADAKAAEQMAKQRELDLSSYEAQRQNALRNEEAREIYMSDQKAKLEQLNARAKNMADVDPERFWHNAGSGSKVMGAIAVALGAAGSALAKTPNVAADIIQRKIDADIDAQKSNIAKYKGDIENQRGLIAEAMRLGMDERQAETAARAQYAQIAAQRIESIAQGAQSELVKARGQAVRGELLQKQADWLAAHNSITEQNSYRYAPPAGGGGPVAPPPVYDDVKKDEVVKGADGRQYEFGASASAQEASKRIAGINQQEADSAELQRLVSNPANLLPGSAGRAQADAISARMIENAKTAENGPNRLSKEAIDLLERARGGDPTALLKFNKVAGIKEYRAGLRSEREGLIKQHAISEVKPYRATDYKTGKTDLRYVRKNAGPQSGPDVSGAEVGE